MNYPDRMPPWAFMWGMALLIFAMCKMYTFRLAKNSGVKTTLFRSIAYLFFWPGMDASMFLAAEKHAKPPGPGLWVPGAFKAAIGAGLVWGPTRHGGGGLLSGWLGMIGIILILHFGLFDILAAFWQWLGICAKPLMNRPIMSNSLNEFWARRWNSGFNDLAQVMLFRPMCGYAGVRWAAMSTFIVSGLLHDIVIFIPAGGGYGLPTLYFTIQGAGVLVERSAPGIRLGLRNPGTGRLFALAMVSAPVFLLFPPVFVTRVIVPFLHMIRAL